MVPQIIHFNRVFHYQLSILDHFGVPLFLETPKYISPMDGMGHVVIPGNGVAKDVFEATSLGLKALQLDVLRAKGNKNTNRDKGED